MFRTQISPRATAIATAIVLAVVTGVYWRLLVYKEPGSPPGGGGGGGGGPATKIANGLEEVSVDTFAGEVPGFADGPGWSARFAGPSALAAAPDGSVFVADSRNHRIRQVSPTGRVSTAAGGGTPGGSGGMSDGPAAQALFRLPAGVAVGAGGVLFIADTGNHRICRLKDGVVSTLAGGKEGKADGPGRAAQFRLPGALAVDPSGTLWVSDTGNQAVRRVDPQGNVTTPAAVPPAVRDVLGPPRPVAEPILAYEGGVVAPTEYRLGRATGATVAGAVKFFADATTNVLMARQADGSALLVAGRRQTEPPPPESLDGPGHRAYFAVPCAVAAGPGGVVYVADYEGNRIRRVRVPGWLTAGESAPVNTRERWRGPRGS
jgi:hypothetical protein